MDNEAFFQDMNLRERAKATWDTLNLQYLLKSIIGIFMVLFLVVCVCVCVCVYCRKFILPCIIFSQLF